MDWDLAARTGERVAPGGPQATREEASAVVAQLQDLARQSVGFVADVTGMTASGESAQTVIVDRPAWIRSNLSGFEVAMAPMLDKVAERSRSVPLGGIGGKVSGLQIGAVLGWLSGKVLGQYEAFVPAGQTGRLLLVAPNIVTVERTLEVDPRDFRLWVCLHEETHRVQFGAVPWLSDYFLGQVNEFMMLADLGPGEAAKRLVVLLRTGARILAGDRDASILEAAQTEEQREVFERLTALMALLEGHAEYVMDAVGPDVVPSVETLRGRFERRRGEVAASEGLLRRLLGMDAKMRQYAHGRAFVTEVVAKVGIDGFNQIWSEPAALPLADEIDDPEAWVRRVHGLG